MKEHVCDEKCVCPLGHGPLVYSKAHRAHACREPSCDLEMERRRRVEVRNAREGHEPGCPARRELDAICRCRHLRGEIPPPPEPEEDESREPWVRL